MLCAVRMALPQEAARLTSCLSRDATGQAGREGCTHTRMGSDKDMGEERTEHPDCTVLLAERRGIYRPALRILLFLVTSDIRPFGAGKTEAWWRQMQNNECRGRMPKQPCTLNGAVVLPGCPGERLRIYSQICEAINPHAIRKLSSDRDCRQNNFPDNSMNEEWVVTKGSQIK